MTPKHERSLADRAGFELLGRGLASDLKAAIETALAGGVVFEIAGGSLAVFRGAFASAVGDITTHPRGELFQRFLSKGPYENKGKIPAKLRNERLSDAETASAIAFIHGHMVNCLKEAVTELLASKPCLDVVRRLQREGALPAEARLYVGDAVLARKRRGDEFAKGGDLHVLIDEGDSCVTVAGVAEVKSYFRTERVLRRQLDQHLRRAKRGLLMGGAEYPRERVHVGYGKDARAVRIAVLPSDWTLPRTFRFEETKHGRSLHVDPGVPLDNDSVEQVEDNEWRITLKWSKEALAQAAYEMTLWYMEKVGEVIYAKTRPKGWEEMTPEEAGANAARMMLYYAILRCRTSRENQHAIALYNTYGFGYALGMNFRDAEGKREMLWPEDLDEILASGKTKRGCRIAVSRETR